MKDRIIEKLIKLLVDMISEDLVRDTLINSLNFLEQEIVKTKNKYDDKIILPVIQLLRDIVD